MAAAGDTVGESLVPDACVCMHVSIQVCSVCVCLCGCVHVSIHVYPCVYMSV